MVSMPGYWNAYKLDIPMQLPMAMAMMMISSERKLPSMTPSQDEAHTMIGDFTEITISNSDNDLLLEQATSARTDGRMLDGLSDAGHSESGEMQDGVTLDLPSFSSLYIFTSLDLGPVPMALARVFTTSGDTSGGAGVRLCAGSAESLP